MYIISDGAWDVDQLRTDLASLKIPVKKDAMKRIIAFYTLGQDMSQIFVDVVNCMQTGMLNITNSR